MKAKLKVRNKQVRDSQAGKPLQLVVPATISQIVDSGFKNSMDNAKFASSHDSNQHSEVANPESNPMLPSDGEGSPTFSIKMASA